MTNKNNDDDCDDNEDEGGDGYDDETTHDNDADRGDGNDDHAGDGGGPFFWHFFVYFGPLFLWCRMGSGSAHFHVYLDPMRNYSSPKKIL